MLTTTERCSSRSSIALATITSSPKTFPQEAIPRLVVKTTLPFKYLWLTTWNRADAASAGSGRYPTSSTYADIGIG